MKVILLQDVAKVGKKQQIVEVSDGFGVNFLINKKLAVPANDTNLAALEKSKQTKQEEQIRMKENSIKLKEVLEKITLEFALKKGIENRAFGSVTHKMIEQELQSKHNIAIDKRKFVDNISITSFGYFNVKIELFKDIIATIKVHVVEK